MSAECALISRQVFFIYYFSCLLINLFFLISYLGMCVCTKSHVAIAQRLSFTTTNVGRPGTTTEPLQQTATTRRASTREREQMGITMGTRVLET
jgi:hypothetical protein